MCAKLLKSCLTFAIPWSVARQAPPSMGCSRQDYWSGEKEMATHSSILAWKSPRTEKPGGL